MKNCLSRARLVAPCSRSCKTRAAKSPSVSPARDVSQAATRSITRPGPATFDQAVTRTGLKARPRLSEASIRALLEGEIRRQKLQTSRSNKINRSYYSRQLGVTPGALTRFNHIFNEYERRLNVVTGPLRHLAQMNTWLDAEYAAGRIRIRDGKVDRKQFAKKFSLKGGTFLTRYPEIRDLLESYDERVRRDNYLPLDNREELSRLKAALLSNPELNRDRVSINLEKLAKLLNIPRHRLSEDHFAREIAAQHEEILAAAKESRIDPFVHNRVFPFSQLAKSWPTSFLERVGIRFKQTLATLAAPKHPYLNLVALLAWIGESAEPACHLVIAEANEAGRIKSADQWEDVLFAYRDSLVAQIGIGKLSEGTVDTALTALRIALDTLSSAQIVPFTSIPLPGVKHARRLAHHKKSVAEATSVVGSGGLADYLAFARTIFVEACRKTGYETDMEESEAFIAGLGADLQHQPALLSKSPTDAVRAVLSRRLELVKSRAATIVNAGMQAYLRGRELLKLATVDAEVFQRLYFDTATRKREKDTLLRHVFNTLDESADAKEQGLANLLHLITDQHRGIPPSGSTEEYGQFFAKRYLQYGGRQAIASLILPDADAVGATLTLYLAESGANISVGRTLDSMCMESSDLEDHVRITGHKARARGKPIIVDIPTGSHAARAMDWIREASEPMRRVCDVDSDRLFVLSIGSRVQLMDAQWYTAHFKRFASSIDGLQGLSILPSMIRPSVLLDAALGNDGRLALGQSVGQHNGATSQGYQQKWPTRLLYDENIRRFTNAFETVVLSSIEDAARRLGLSVEAFEARIDELRSSGLGTFCMALLNRIGQSPKGCPTMGCWDDCPHLLIIAQTDSIALLQLWQQSLRSVQGDWERDHIERWERLWLPWMCLTDVVEEKMVRGPLLKIWLAAQKRAAAISAAPGFVPPRPF